MQVKLISTTNPSFQYIENEIGSLSFTHSCGVFYYGKLLQYYLITSTILKESLTKDTLTIETLNSVYVFQIIKDD